MLSLAIRELVVDLNIQPRANGLDQDHADGMAEYLRANPRNDLPAVVVYRDPATGDHVLSEGFHRAEAYARAGRTHLPADVRDGDRLAAVANAMASNQAHGLKRTNADKRRAAEQMVRLFPDWSDRRIADHIGVSHEFVRQARPGTVSTVDTGDKQKSERRTGKDGVKQPATKPAKDNPGAKEHAQKSNPDSTTQTPEPETEQPDTSGQADTADDPRGAFNATLAGICYALDAQKKAVKDLAGPFAGLVHVESVTDSIEAARKALWQSQATEPCCDRPDCRRCLGTGYTTKAQTPRTRAGVAK